MPKLKISVILFLLQNRHNIPTAERKHSLIFWLATVEELFVSIPVQNCHNLPTEVRCLNILGLGWLGSSIVVSGCFL